MVSMNTGNSLFGYVKTFGLTYISKALCKHFMSYLSLTKTTFLCSFLNEAKLQPAAVSFIKHLMVLQFPNEHVISDLFKVQKQSPHRWTATSRHYGIC